MRIFKQVPYSTTTSFLEKLLPMKRRQVSGLGTSLSMSNDMMLGMALGGVIYLVMKKKGLLVAKARA